MIDVLSLPFDQYQRYRLVSDLLNEVRPRGKSYKVLDVGGRTGLLAAFLPADRVFMVDTEASDVAGLVLGSGANLPYQDKSLDVIAAFDTLEHVPPPARAAFLTECARVAKHYVVLAGPYQSPEVEEAERILQQFLKDKLGVEHRYLEEHRHFGLPTKDDVERHFQALSAQVVSIGHGNLERWLALMCMSLYMDYTPQLASIAARFYRFYNQNLYVSDHGEPVYRHAIVAVFGGAPVPTAAHLLGAPVAPPGAMARLNELAFELVAFNRVLEAMRREVNEYKADLAGHKDTIESLRADLEGHRQTVANLTRQREELMRFDTPLRKILKIKVLRALKRGGDGAEGKR